MGNDPEASCGCYESLVSTSGLERQGKDKFCLFCDLSKGDAIVRFGELAREDCSKRAVLLPVLTLCARI